MLPRTPSTSAPSLKGRSISHRSETSNRQSNGRKSPLTVLAHELPDIFGWVELWGLWRERQQGDVVGQDELVGRVPAGLIEHDEGMGARVDDQRDFVQMPLHRRGVALGQDEACSLAFGGTDGAVATSGRRKRLDVG